EVDAHLFHDGDDLRVHTLARLRSGGHRPGLAAVGHGVEESRRDLGTTSVVNTGENDAVHDASSVCSWCGTTSSGASNSAVPRPSATNLRAKVDRAFADCAASRASGRWAAIGSSSPRTGVLRTAPSSPPQSAERGVV